MKKSKKLIGIMGEEIACSFLRHQGYQILERNYSCKYGELDIIACIQGIIIIVEVKTRKNDEHSYACQSITQKKVLNIKRATNEYLATHQAYNQDYRFDVIECYWQSKTIHHIMDAF